MMSNVAAQRIAETEEAAQREREERRGHALVHALSRCIQMGQLRGLLAWRAFTLYSRQQDALASSVQLETQHKRDRQLQALANVMRLASTWQRRTSLRKWRHVALSMQRSATSATATRISALGKVVSHVLLRGTRAKVFAAWTRYVQRAREAERDDANAVLSSSLEEAKQQSLTLQTLLSRHVGVSQSLLSKHLAAQSIARQASAFTAWRTHAQERKAARARIARAEAMNVVMQRGASKKSLADVADAFGKWRHVTREKAYRKAAGKMRAAAIVGRALEARAQAEVRGYHTGEGMHCMKMSHAIHALFSL